MAPAGARPHHVVQVPHVRRVGRGLQGREPGAADGRGRQAAVQSRVEGRGVAQLGLPQRARPVVQREAQGGVDAQRDRAAQAVPDHGGDERALLRHLSFALDHGGDGDHVVGGEVRAAGAAQADPAEALAEGLDLLVHQARGRRPAPQLIGGGEQKPLQAGRPARRPVAARVQAARARAGGQVGAGQARPAHEDRRLAPRSPLGDHHAHDGGSGRPGGEALERGAVAHVPGQQVAARLELGALARQAGPQAKEHARAHHALLGELVADVPHAGARRDLDGDLAAARPVLEGLKQRDAEPHQPTQQRQEHHQRDAAAQVARAARPRPAAVLGARDTLAQDLALGGRARRRGRAGSGGSCTAVVGGSARPSGAGSGSGSGSGSGGRPARRAARSAAARSRSSAERSRASERARPNGLTAPPSDGAPASPRAGARPPARPPRRTLRARCASAVVKRSS